MRMPTSWGHSRDPGRARAIPVCARNGPNLDNRRSSTQLRSKQSERWDREDCEFSTLGEDSFAKQRSQMASKSVRTRIGSWRTSICSPTPATTRQSSSSIRRQKVHVSHNMPLFSSWTVTPNRRAQRHGGAAGYHSFVPSKVFQDSSGVVEVTCAPHFQPHLKLSCQPFSREYILEATDW